MVGHLAWPPRFARYGRQRIGRRLKDHRVVPVGSHHPTRQRQALGIGHKVALRPSLPRSVGLGPVCRPFRGWPRSPRQRGHGRSPTRQRRAARPAAADALGFPQFPRRLAWTFKRCLPPQIVLGSIACRAVSRADAVPAMRVNTTSCNTRRRSASRVCCGQIVWDETPGSVQIFIAAPSKSIYNSLYSTKIEPVEAARGARDCC